MKKVLSVAVLVCMLVTCLAFAACDISRDDGAVAFVSIDINPSIEMTLDKNNKVLSVRGANEDGQVLLYGELIVGLPVEEAVEKITTLSVELGYLNGTNSVVETSVTSVKNNSDRILQNVNAKVSATAEKLNLSVSCSGEAAYSLSRKLEQIKALYPESKAVQSLTPSKLKLVLAASENGVSIEAAAEMNTDELVKLASEYQSKAEEFATSAYIKAKDAALSAYESALGIAQDSVYTAFYAVNFLAHPTTVYYGALYQSYKMAALSLDAMAQGLAYVEKAVDYPLDKEQISKVSEALGLGTDLSQITDSDGNVTLKSVYAYADKVFKNSEVKAELDELKIKLDEALTTVENQLKLKIEELANKYEPEINALVEKYGEAVAAVKSVADKWLSADTKKQIEAILAECAVMGNRMADIVKDGKITSDEVKILAADANKKADEILSKIEKDLSADELAQIESNKQTIAETFAKAKAEMEEALANAEREARAKLQELKEARLAAKA